MDLDGLGVAVYGTLVLFVFVGLVALLFQSHCFGFVMHGYVFDDNLFYTVSNTLQIHINRL